MRQSEPQEPVGAGGDQGPADRLHG
jgi:hypothetical protein